MAGATDHPLYLRAIAVPGGPVQQTTPSLSLLELAFGATGVPGGPVQQTTPLLQLPLDGRRRADNPHVYAGRTCMGARG